MANLETDFTPALELWLISAQEIVTNHYQKDLPNMEIPTLSLQEGRRYIRVVHSSNGAHAFIDKTNGDVLKPASWKAPAKGRRGNIFDQSNGMARMGEYGPAYNYR